VPPPAAPEPDAGFQPPPAPDWVDVEAVRSGGSLRDVAVGLKEHETRIRDCYEQWAAVHGQIQGKLQFEVTVPPGSVGQPVQPKASHVWAVDEGESLEACANKALADLNFSAPEEALTFVWQVP